MNFQIGCCLAFAFIAPAALAQKTDVPIRNLSAPLVSTRKFTNSTFGVGELAGGRVLVRDNSQRRLIVFDSSLSQLTVLADAEGRTRSFYPTGIGFASAPLVYPGDTLMLIDLSVPGFVAVTPQGKLGSVISHPVGSHLTTLMEREGASIGFDNRGRFVYREMRRAPTADQFKGGTSRDTIAILRADLDKRAVDTIARYGVPVAWELQRRVVLR